MFVAACAYISAIFLVLEAKRRGQQDLIRYFLLRATAAGVLTGALAAITFAELSRSAPHVYAGLTGRALPLVAISVTAGIAVLAMIWLRWYSGLRPAAAIAVVTVVWGWGLAQYPELLPGSLSLAAGSAPPAALLAELVIAAIAFVIVGPAFGLLYWLQQRGKLTETETATELRQAAHLTPAPPGGQAPAGSAPTASKLTMTLALAVVTIKAIKDMFSPSRRPAPGHDRDPRHSPEAETCPACTSRSLPGVSTQGGLVSCHEHRGPGRDRGHGAGPGRNGHRRQALYRRSMHPCPGALDKQGERAG